MDLTQAMQIAAAGMKVQGVRMRMLAQNLANAESTATTPGGQPYRRQTVTFENVLDRELGVELVQVARAPGSTARRYRCATTPGIRPRTPRATC
jgi:flagellar basal-body rod protein FlgC